MHSLQMMRGSHKLGRLDSAKEEWYERHIAPERIELAIKAGCEPVYCEQEPGDCAPHPPSLPCPF